MSGNTSEYGGADESEGMVLSLNTHKKKRLFNKAAASENLLSQKELKR